MGVGWERGRGGVNKTGDAIASFTGGMGIEPSAGVEEGVQYG